MNHQIPNGARTQPKRGRSHIYLFSVFSNRNSNKYLFFIIDVVFPPVEAQHTRIYLQDRSVEKSDVIYPILCSLCQLYYFILYNLCRVSKNFLVVVHSGPMVSKHGNLGPVVRACGASSPMDRYDHCYMPI